MVYVQACPSRARTFKTVYTGLNPHLRRVTIRSLIAIGRNRRISDILNLALSRSFRVSCYTSLGFLCRARRPSDKFRSSQEPQPERCLKLLA